MHVDDEVVGVVWPFEVVFTGGICPTFWHKIVDHRTFDLPAYQIDLTPFLDRLRNSEHRIRFSMRGQPNILQNWYVSGHLEIWYSKNLKPTLMSIDELSISPTTNITSTGRVATDNTSFSVMTLASRRESLYSLEYENRQFYQLLNNGSTLFNPVFQRTDFNTPLSYGHYIFSLNATETSSPNGSIALLASLFQVFHRYSISAIDGSVSLEHAEVSTIGTFIQNGNMSLGHGNTSVSFRYSSPRREYVRNVKAVGTQIVYDETDDQLVV